MMSKVTNPIHIVMKNAPGPDSDFIEVENDLGESVKAGEWYRYRLQRKNYRQGAYA